MADTAERFGGADDTPAAGNSGAISHPQDVGVGAVLAVGQYKTVGANPIVATKDQKSAGESSVACAAVLHVASVIPNIA
jgi:hypothetical protein